MSNFELVMNFGKFILLILEVMLTSFQSMSITSQIYFHFNFIFLGFGVPIILNNWMLPAVLHSFIGTYYCTSEINSIILTVLENKHPLHNFNFLDQKL